jgi:hypothetical protein
MMTILVPIFGLLAVVPLIRHRDRAGRALPVLGWRRPLPAAVLLLVATVLPMVFNILGSGAPLSAAFGGSLSAATAPGAVTGMLYLLSVIFERQSVAHPAPPNAAPTPA